MSRNKQVSLRTLFVLCVAALMALSLLWGGGRVAFPFDGECGDGGEDGGTDS